MTLTLELTPAATARLRQQAEAAGQDLMSYAARLLERAAARPALDELLAPLRREFAESGMSDDELIARITEAQSTYRSDRQKTA